MLLWHATKFNEIAVLDLMDWLADERFTYGIKPKVFVRHSTTPKS